MWNYLTEDWRLLLPSPWAHIGLALVAIVSGAMVGAERERREKPAGLRTLVLVSLGAAVFTMISFAFTSTTGDSGRVAAQVVTGIGFLGAGVILQARGTVTGTTTASSIWTTAAIGMVVGAGYAGAGVGLSLLVRGALTGIRWWEHHWLDELHAFNVEVVFDPNHGKTRVRLEKILQDFHPHRQGVAWLEGPEGWPRLRLALRLPRKHRCELLDELAAVPEVRELRVQSASAAPA